MNDQALAAYINQDINRQQWIQEPTVSKSTSDLSSYNDLTHTDQNTGPVLSSKSIKPSRYSEPRFDYNRYLSVQESMVQKPIFDSNQSIDSPDFIDTLMISDISKPSINHSI